MLGEKLELFESNNEIKSLQKTTTNMYITEQWWSAYENKKCVDDGKWQSD